MGVAAFNRTLEQELLALSRGISLECLICGEFVLHRDGRICCPECGAELLREGGEAGLQLSSQAG